MGQRAGQSQPSSERAPPPLGDGDQVVVQLPGSSRFQIPPHPPPPTCLRWLTKAATLRLHRPGPGPAAQAQAGCPASSDGGGARQRATVTSDSGAPDHKAPRTFLVKAPGAQAVTLLLSEREDGGEDERKPGSALDKVSGPVTTERWCGVREARDRARVATDWLAWGNG